MLCVDEWLRVFMLNTGKYTKVLVYFVANASVTRQCHKAYIFIYHMNPFSQTKAPRRQISFKMYLISVYSLKEKNTHITTKILYNAILTCVVYTMNEYF